MLEKNRIALKEKGILKAIENCKDDPNIKIENGKLFYGDVELDEKKEVKDSLKPIDTIFLHGFGYGNTLMELREAFPETVVVVLETNPCIIKKTLENRDLSDILEDNKVVIVLVSDKIAEDNIRTIINLLKSRLNWGDAKEFISPGYDKIDSYKFTEIRNILQKELQTIFVNRNTLILKSVDISTNAIRNLPYLIKNGSDIEYFNDAFKDKPAIIVASGPSLSKNVEYLKDVKDKAVVIAADSVISTLDNIGVKPDFVCGVDYQRVNELKYRSILKKREVSDFVYVAIDGVYFSLPKLFRFSFFELSNLLNADYGDIFGKPKKKHFVINNVTNLAIQLAYVMGANPIIFIGQDWAFSYAQAHVKGVELEGMVPADVMWVKGNYEEKVPTSEVLYSGLKLVEDIIRHTKDEGIKYINATEGGAYIEGTEVITFKDAINRYLEGEIDKSFLKNLKIEPRFEPFIERTKKISNHLGEIVKKASKALAIDNKVLKRWMRNRNVDEIRKDVELVNKINDEITFDTIFSTNVANFFFKEFFNFYRDEMYIEGQDTKKRIEQSIKYFKLIREKSVLVKKKLDELLDILTLEKEYFENKKKFLKNINKIIKLAELYYEFKDIYSGLEFVNEAIKLYPENAVLYYWKAKLHSLNRFMHKEALESFEKALELDPDFEKARFDYEVEKKMVVSHMILIRRTLENRNFHEAKTLIKNALDYDPDNEELKRWSEIIEEMSKIDNDARRQTVLFEQLKIEGEAFEKYKTAIEFVKKEEFDKAFELLKDLYDKHGAFGDIPFLLGSIYIDKKEFDKAEKYLKEAVELIPYQPLVYLALGKLYIEKEEYFLAKENLEKAIAMNPDLKPGVLDTLGNLYYEFGEYEKAFRAFEEFLQYSDDKIKTLTKIAVCYKEMGMVEEYNKLMSKIREITDAN